MHERFWLERWERGEIGFHQQSAHRYLRRYWASLDLPPGARVFVPLCGKSRDMLWLRDAGFEVIGVELSLTAAKAFCEENALPLLRVREGVFECFRGAGISLLVGDFFDLRPDDLDGVAAVFDRAAAARARQVRGAHGSVASGGRADFAGDPRIRPRADGRAAVLGDRR